MGDYLIELCCELVEDYGFDGFSFDGNYHPPICYCPACDAAHRSDRKRDLPARVNLDDVAYREYLVWRGERLEDHYLRLKHRVRKANPNAVSCEPGGRVPKVNRTGEFTRIEMPPLDLHSILVIDR